MCKLSDENEELRQSLQKAESLINEIRTEITSTIAQYTPPPSDTSLPLEDVQMQHADDHARLMEDIARVKNLIVSAPSRPKPDTSPTLNSGISNASAQQCTCVPSTPEHNQRTLQVDELERSTQDVQKYRELLKKVFTQNKQLSTDLQTAQETILSLKGEIAKASEEQARPEARHNSEPTTQSDEIHIDGKYFVHT